MENSIIIGCDIGNKLIKTASSITPAGLQKLTGTPVVAPADPQEYLLVNGEHYLVSNKRIAYERDKSGSQAHLYLAMIALAKELRNRNLSPNSEITLAVGLPPGHMADQEVVNHYREYFRQNGGLYRFQAGGVSYQVKVKDLIVCPQAYSVLFTLPQNILEYSSLRVVDIGGGTVDTIHIENGTPDPLMPSLDMGVIFLYGKIFIQLQNRFGRKISESQVDEILLGKQSFFSEEQKQVVRYAARSHMQEIFDGFRETGEDWRSSYVVFCGGGSALLKEPIQELAGKYTGAFQIVDDVCANAKGYEVFAHMALKARRK